MTGRYTDDPGIELRRTVNRRRDIRNLVAKVALALVIVALLFFLFSCGDDEESLSDTPENVAYVDPGENIATGACFSDKGPNGKRLQVPCP